MSNLFDDLARSLASSMSRRRALRMLGGAVVAAVLPGLQARPARAHSVATCGPGTELCTNGKGSEVCMPAGGTCCIFPDIIVGCRPGYQCGQSRNAPCICRGVECVNRCCPSGKDCEDGKCVSCTSERKCGQDCCKKTEFCASPRQSLCCTNSDNYCAVLPKPGSGGKAGKVTCCPKGTHCCANDQRTDCCGPDQKCSSGKCACPSGTTECGPDCCKKSEICSNGKCCPKGKVNCGGKGKCCAKIDCCGGTCCEGDALCANGTCCPPGRGVGSGTNARCCPPGTVPSDGSSACCPKNDPECCNDGELRLLCPRGKICVKGACVQL